MDWEIVPGKKPCTWRILTTEHAPHTHGTLRTLEGLRKLSTQSSAPHTIVKFVGGASRCHWLGEQSLAHFSKPNSEICELRGERVGLRPLLLRLLALTRQPRLLFFDAARLSNPHSEKVTCG